MPLAAREIGQADLVLPVGRIATALELLAQSGEESPHRGHGFG